MTVVANVDAISKGVEALTGKINALDAAIKKASGDAGTGFKGILSSLGSFGGQKNLGKGSAGSSMGSSLAGFSTPSGGSAAESMSATSRGGGGFGFMPRAAAISGMADMAMAPFAMAYGAAMPTGDVVNRAQSYFQATRMYGLARTPIEQQTLRTLGPGMTSVGSDANVAAILAGRGFIPGSQNYLNTVAQVRGAALNYGIGNEAAASALASLSNIPQSNALISAGVLTMNPNGTQRNFGDIATDMFRRMYGRQKITAKDVGFSIQSGDLAAQLQGFGITDPTEQQMFMNAFTDIASGKSADLTKLKNMEGNKNPALAMYKMNESQTGVMQKSEQNVLTGLDASAKVVTTFNNVMGGAIAQLSTLKAFLDGVNSTNAGKGIKSGGNWFMKGLKKVAGAALLAASMGEEVFSGGTATPVAVGQAALGINLMTGGGTPGFGVPKNSPGPRGGGTPSVLASPTISAGYGVTDSSGIWASTGNTHKGVDYNVPVGTDVHAVMSGIVSNQVLSSDYGQAVLINHANGYQSLYAHLSNKSVSPGTVVARGQTIGKSGKSGNTTGPSLHYEVRHGLNNPVDPSTVSDFSSPIQTSGGLLAPSSGESSFKKSLEKNYQQSQSSLLPTPKGANKGGALSQNEILGILKKAGFKGQALTNAYNVSMLESGHRPTAYNGVGPDNSYGLFQINMIGQLGVERNKKYLKEYGSIGYKGPESLLDPYINARIAYDISSKGRKWSDAWVNSSKSLNIGGGTPGAKGVELSTSQQLISNSLPGSGMYSGNNNYNTVTINVNIAQASETEAKLFAKRVKDYLEHDNSISKIGGM